MKSQPYQNVRSDIAEVVERLLSGADEYHQTHRARFARTIDVLLGQKPRGKLLELGTSSFIPHALRELAPGLDVSVTHFDRSRPATGTMDLEFAGAVIDVKCFSVDLETEMLSAEDKSFDVVVCCEVLEHMEVDPMFMLAEANRILKDGGLLLLTTPNILSSRGITKMLTNIEPYFFMQYNRDGSYYRHNYEYSAKTLRSVLASAGFEGDVWSEDLFEDGLYDFVNRLRAAGFDIRNNGDNLIAVVKKVSGVLDRYPREIYV